MTPGQLRAATARAVLEADPEAARRRREEAAKDARVTRWREDAGTAALSGRDLPPAEVLAADQRITDRARELRAAGQAGTMDELRARAYLDFLLDRPLPAPGPQAGAESAGAPSGAAGGALARGSRWPGGPDQPHRAAGHPCPSQRPCGAGGGVRAAGRGPGPRHRRHRLRPSLHVLVPDHHRPRWTGARARLRKAPPQLFRRQRPARRSPLAGNRSPAGAAGNPGPPVVRHHPDRRRRLRPSAREPRLPAECPAAPSHRDAQHPLHLPRMPAPGPALRPGPHPALRPGRPDLRMQSGPVQVAITTHLVQAAPRRSRHG